MLAQLVWYFSEKEKPHMTEQNQGEAARSLLLEHTKLRLNVIEKGAGTSVLRAEYDAASRTAREDLLFIALLLAGRPLAPRDFA